MSEHHPTENFAATAPIQFPPEKTTRLGDDEFDTVKVGVVVDLLESRESNLGDNNDLPNRQIMPTRQKRVFLRPKALETRPGSGSISAARIRLRAQRPARKN